MEAVEATISKTFIFDAAHHLPMVAPGHQCRRNHGHTYRVTVDVVGPVEPVAGWVLDFGTIGGAMRRLLALVDHYDLNEVPTAADPNGFLANPTAENVAVWFLHGLTGEVAGLHAVTVQEGEGGKATVYEAALP